MTSRRRTFDSPFHRRHSSAKVAWLLLAMAVMLVLAVAEAIVAHTVTLVLVGSTAVAGAYVLGRRHGSRRPYQRDRARRLEESARLGQAAELERLANRSLDEILSSYRVIARRYQGGQP